MGNLEACYLNYSFYQQQNCTDNWIALCLCLFMSASFLQQILNGSSITFNDRKCKDFFPYVKVLVTMYGCMLIILIHLLFTEYKQYFAISNDTTFIQSRFDFNSITFFYPYAYAKDPSKPSMTAKYEGDAIPWKVSLSVNDVHNLKRGYGCGGGMSYRHKQTPVLNFPVFKRSFP